MSLCVRYISLDGDIQILEEFLQFIPVVDMRGEALAKTILLNLEKYKLNLNLMRGQGYDGAPAMSGHLNGVKAHILKKYPSAIYVHCASHSLNLAISDSCALPSIRNSMAIISKIYDFFKYPKRSDVLNRTISKNAPETHHQKLKKMCPTRWVLRHDSVSAFIELEEMIRISLHEITKWQDSNVSSEAISLLNSIDQSEFIIAASCINKLFSYSSILCRNLQKPNLDLVQVIDLAENIYEQVDEIRTNVDEYFHNIYVDIESKAQIYDISIIKPRLAPRQLMRCRSTEDYYKISIFIPFLDTFLSKILLPKDPSSFSHGTIDKIKYLAKFYSYDIDSEINLISEFELWYRYLLRLPILPEHAIDALNRCKDILAQFPNILKLFYILACLPITTCTNERTFSNLRRLKTYLRSNTYESRLNGLALLNIHRDLVPTTNEILDTLATFPRKLKITL
ncbi:unnamed protein product [Gordionus sp. m RMFG-2023]